MNIPLNQVGTPSEILPLKVFTNQHLLDHILNNLPDGLMRNLNLRVVNKQFSDTFIRLIRKNHREIEIEYIGKKESEDIRQNLASLSSQENEYFGNFHAGGWPFNFGMNLVQKDLKPFCVYINYRLVKSTFVDSYFRFIREFADVKVERVITKNLWKLNLSHKKSLHDSIAYSLVGDNNIKALIGIEDICYGCNFCFDIVERCAEYGPANAYCLRDIKTRCHFNKLIVTDETLAFIANDSIVLGSARNEPYYNKVNEYVNSFITCDKLVIWVAEVSTFGNNHPLPREVLDLMLKKWNVKRIELRFLCNSIYNFLNDWSEKGLFTKFRFNDSYDSVGKSTMNLKFDEVIVDLSDSFYCARDISYESRKSNGYENIIANVRRIFPTDKIFIQFSHDYYNNGGAIHTNIDSLLKVANKGNQRDLSIDIRYFTKIETFKFHNPISDKIELSVIPSSIYVNSKELQCSVQKSLIHCYRRRLEENRLNFSNEKYIGKQCRIVSSERNFVLNIDILKKENDKSYEFSEEQLKEQPDAFANHFIPSSHS